MVFNFKKKSKGLWNQTISILLVGLLAIGAYFVFQGLRGFFPESLNPWYSLLLGLLVIIIVTWLSNKKKLNI